jgi:hypothetical protein
MNSNAKIAHALRTQAKALEATADALEHSTSEFGAHDLVPIAVAARIAATSVRVVRDAIRSDDLPAFGKQRDRSVRRSDLDKWIESRRSKPIAGVVDADILRRMDRLARSKKRSAA